MLGGEITDFARRVCHACVLVMDCISHKLNSGKVRHQVNLDAIALGGLGLARNVAGLPNFMALICHIWQIDALILRLTLP